MESCSYRIIVSMESDIGSKVQIYMIKFWNSIQMFPIL